MYSISQIFLIRDSFSRRRSPQRWRRFSIFHSLFVMFLFFLRKRSLANSYGDSKTLPSLRLRKESYMCAFRNSPVFENLNYYMTAATCFLLPSYPQSVEPDLFVSLLQIYKKNFTMQIFFDFFYIFLSPMVLLDIQVLRFRFVCILVPDRILVRLPLLTRRFFRL